MLAAGFLVASRFFVATRWAIQEFEGWVAFVIQGAIGASVVQFGRQAREEPVHRCARDAFDEPLPDARHRTADVGFGFDVN